MALAGRVAAFLHVVADAAADVQRISNDLRSPSGDSGILRGSDLGATLWATDEGTALLDEIIADTDFQAAFDGNWRPKWEARWSIASAVDTWLASRATPEQFADSSEQELWRSLRRREIVACGITVLPGFISPAEGIDIGHGRRIAPPTSSLEHRAFGNVWPEFGLHLPSGPYCLAVTSVSVPRAQFSGGNALAFAYVAAFGVREAVWPATGTLPRIGHTGAWEEDPFPLSRGQHHAPEIVNVTPRCPVHLSTFTSDIQAVAARLAVLGGDEPEPLGFDDETSAVLRTMREDVDAALTTSSSTVALRLAFAAVEGSLTLDSSEKGQVAHRRFGYLCGATDSEAQALTAMMKDLDLVRDQIAHGRRPTNEMIGRFLGKIAWIEAGTERDPFFETLKLSVRHAPRHSTFSAVCI